MNQLQLHSWNQMIALIREFEESKLPFHHLVDGLEAALDEADFKDQALIQAWYEFWNPLEELDVDSSHEIEEVSPAQVFHQLEKMRAFLLEQLRLEGHGPIFTTHKSARHAHH